MNEVQHPGGWVWWWVLAGVAIAATLLPATILAGPNAAAQLTFLPIPLYLALASLVGRVSRAVGKGLQAAAPLALGAYYTVLLLAGFAVTCWG